MRRYTVLAAALVLASLGAAGGQESPLSERVRNTLEAGKRTLEERTEHYKKRREKMASPMRKLAESLREADKPKARERPEDEIDRFIAAERRAEALRTRLVAKGHFYRGKTFITVPIDESLVVTIRKAHISGLLWDRKNDEFELVAEPRDQKPFHVYVDGRAFLRLVTECLD